MHSGMDRKDSFLKGFEKAAVNVKALAAIGAGSLATGYAGKKLFVASQDPEQRAMRQAKKNQMEQLRLQQ